MTASARRRETSSRMSVAVRVMLQAFVLKELYQLAVQPADERDSECLRRLLSVCRDDRFRLLGHRRAGLPGALGRGVCVGRAERHVKEQLLRRGRSVGPRASREQLQVVAVAGVEQRRAAVALALRPAVRAPAVPAAKSQALGIELQRRVEVEDAYRDVMESAAADCDIRARLARSGLRRVTHKYWLLSVVA